mmetsp:Transcript_71914/g.192008  ORF Transcript_71914/g.192008 Transcript_71914/m.192008 type:complete len:299 (-) Transcript_71914:536-1432(-)
MLQDLGDVVGGDGQEVDLVGQALGRLHRGHVGVDEHRVHPVLLERLDRLRPAVVELARLPDRQATRAQHKHLLGLGNHLGVHLRDAHHLGALRRDDAPQLVRLASLAGLHRRDEDVEQALRVARARARLGVELDREDGQRHVDDALVGEVVLVAEQGGPALGQARLVHREAVVLRRDEAVLGPHLSARLIVPAVAIGQLVRLGSGRQGQKLMAKANAENRLDRTLSGAHFAEKGAKIRDGGGCHDRISGAIADKQSVPFGAFDIVVPGNNGHRRSAFYEASQLIQFHAAIDDQNLEFA